ncbi:MAG: hypothetical protein QXO76_09180, partial [Thermoproteota archaeon]
EVVKQLSPKLVVPMHYKVPGLNLPIAGVERFISGKKNVERVQANWYRIDMASLPRDMKIILLSVC